MEQLRALLRAMLQPLEVFGDRDVRATMPRFEVAGRIVDLGARVKDARALIATIDPGSLTPVEQESLRALGEVLASMDLLGDRVIQAPSIEEGLAWSWPMPAYLRGVRGFLAATDDPPRRN
jgi:hypothetical protein